MPALVAAVEVASCARDVDMHYFGGCLGIDGVHAMLRAKPVAVHNASRATWVVMQIEVPVAVITHHRSPNLR
jgi:hypothetical protein